MLEWTRRPISLLEPLSSVDKLPTRLHEGELRSGHVRSAFRLPLLPAAAAAPARVHLAPPPPHRRRLQHPRTPRRHEHCTQSAAREPHHEPAAQPRGGRFPGRHARRVGRRRGRRRRVRGARGCRAGGCGRPGVVPAAGRPERHPPHGSAAAGGGAQRRRQRRRVPPQLPPLPDRPRLPAAPRLAPALAHGARKPGCGAAGWGLWGPEQGGAATGQVAKGTVPLEAGYLPLASLIACSPAGTTTALCSQACPTEKRTTGTRRWSAQPWASRCTPRPRGSAPRAATRCGGRVCWERVAWVDFSAAGGSTPALCCVQEWAAGARQCRDPHPSMLLVAGGESAEHCRHVCEDAGRQGARHGAGAAL